MKNYPHTIFWIIAILWCVMSFFGCNHRDDRLPADLVRNPRSATGNESEVKMPVISFDKTSHDFGRIIMGEKVSHTFRFTNTGQADLIISHVSSSCGCTVPTYTNQPVKPGETGTITVTFDSQNRKGFQHKTVTVMTNTQPNTTTLSIKAMVLTP